MTGPSRIGRFEIVRELGRGAMGLVYLAHDPKIDRKVAIKTIQRNQALADAEAEESRQRFLREAQAAGKLIHPGIVTIFDVGEEQGLSYIAMEYIEGSTLEAFTKADRLLPVEKAVKLIIQACSALDYAHEHKIIHRDVKPANLMIVGDRQVKVTDFGLAKNPSANLTSAGTLIGTPNYMAPEQIMGRPLDGRSDLFSLGVVLYELLTGERPFGGDTISTIIYRILHELPKPPETVNPRVPAALSPAVMRAIEKDPEKRFPTGEELGAALQAYLDSVSPMQVSAAMRASAVREAPPVTTLLPSVAQPAPVPQAPSRPAPGPAADRPARRRAAAPHAPVKAERSAAPLLVAAVLLAAAGAGGWYFRPQIAAALGLAKPEAGGPATAGGEPSAAKAAGAAEGPKVDLPVELPRGEVRSIRVETSPPGGRIYLDNREVTGGVVVLEKSDTGTHALVAENDCFVDKTALRAGETDAVTIPLRTPKLHQVRVTSEPPGARVRLDGRDLRTQAPADLAVTACEPHVISAVLPGFQEASRKFGADTVWAQVGAVDLALAKLPDGRVTVKAPYAVEVLEGGRPVGRSGSPVTLPAGRHTLTFVNKELFVEVTADVDVAADQTVPARADFPDVGQITVHANPSNGDVFVNGRKIGAPPIIGQPLAEGTYTIRFVLESGEADEKTVLVIAGQTQTVKFILRS